MSELKPCPFCGGKNHAKIESKKRNVWRNGFGDEAIYETFHVRCTICHSRGPTISGIVGRAGEDGKIVIIYGENVTLHRYSYFADKAAEAWNKRKNCPECIKEDKNDT